MRFFLDTEFIERGRQFPIELISIGLVTEDQNSYYAASNEFNPNNASEWVKKNVLAQLKGPMKPLQVIAEELKIFVDRNSEGSKPEFWGYYADYDWVVFCQLFGIMVDLPKDWPKYCRDLKQYADSIGGPRLPVQVSGEHDSLEDAKWNLRVYEFLKERQSQLTYDR
jgi:3' exoribonuclease, RNase T-like